MTDPDPQSPERQDDSVRRCAFIAVVGAPNAGKSTLVNALVGAKVSIVSHKVQTTRAPVRAIAIVGTSQLVFVDTPGIFRPRRRLDRAMVHSALGGAAGADRVVMLFDAAKAISEDIAPFREAMANITVPFVVAFNKIDKVKSKHELLDLVQALDESKKAEKVFMISALTQDGVEDLNTYLAETAPIGPWHFSADDISDAPMRLWAAEITREKIYNFLHQELPYETAVETTSWKDLKDGSVRIEQTIYVARESQRKIMLGKSGQTVKKISLTARKELAETLERNVHLFLFVKVRENWSTDPGYFREMGLDYPGDD